MLKIGLLGIGHLGKIHAKCIQMLPEYFDFVGLYDPQQAQAANIAEGLGVHSFSSLDDLLQAVEAVDIVTPTTTHFDLASRAIALGKHVFIEKPITHTLEEAEALLHLVQQQRVKVQVGHVERFNPALLAIQNFEIAPMFVEAHRLATFNPRGTDVSVVLDLMIHDIDILLNLVKEEVSHVSASGVAVLSQSPDIANARVEFKNGCVANLTASRISLKQMRKLRFFQKDAYISLDLLEKNAQVVRLYEEKPLSEMNYMELETGSGKKYLHVEMPEISALNAIKMELQTFAESILHDQDTKVTVQDGVRALRLAYQIMHDMEQRQANLHHAQH